LPRPLFVLCLILLVGTYGCKSARDPHRATESAAPAASAESTGRGDGLAAPHLPAFLESGLATDTLRFRHGDTLDGLLRRAGIGSGDRAALAEAVGPVFDLGGFRTGHALHVLRFADGEAACIHYPLDFLRDLCAWRARAGFAAEIFTAELDWRPRPVHAELESSFYESLAEQGENGDLATRVADLFAGEIDFFFDLRQGDRMELLVESGERPDHSERHDRVLAARMILGGERSEAFLFPDSDGRRRYYHRDGSSLERQFLRAPLNYSRISSGFSHRRLHPILGVRRPHRGVDYAAPIGTPVMATADGTVIDRRRNGGAGRYLKVRHASGIETTYMHLSRWARGSSVGQRVRKGQEIGYVGSSGLSTGPHLDYRIKVDGLYVDPRRFRSDPAAPLPEERRAQFAEELERYDRLWESLAGEESTDAVPRLSSLGTASSAAP